MSRKAKYRRCISGIILSTVFVGDILAVEFSGQVKINEKGHAAAAKEYQDVVIYFIPDAGISDLAPLAEVEMRMENKLFIPRVIPVTLGTNVNFPNFDLILHNVFSTANRNNFNLGLYSAGKTESHMFGNVGLVRVYCDVHHSMVGYILVLNTPYFTKLGSDGRFNLQNLPSESGTLYLWHPRAKMTKQKIDFSRGLRKDKDARFKLNLVKRRIPKHNNKAGKPYLGEIEFSY